MSNKREKQDSLKKNSIPQSKQRFHGEKLLHQAEQAKKLEELEIYMY